MPPETTIEEQLPTSEDQAAESTEEGSGREGSSDGSGSTDGGRDGS